MLALSRKPGERLIIEVGNVVLTVKAVEIDRGRVRLGIEAPADVIVTRDEIASHELRGKADALKLLPGR